MKERIAYLVTRYPKLSESFVRDELTALGRQVGPVALYALLPGRELPGSGAGVDPQRPTYARPRRPAWLWAQLFWLLRAPRSLLFLWLYTLPRHLQSPRRLAQACLGLAAAGLFAREMRRRGVERVHAHWATHSALTAWAIHRLAGIPYSFTAHADDIFVRRPMLAEKVREADFVVTISEFNRRTLLRQLGDWAAPRLRVIHCGVDTRAFSPAPQPPDARPFRILSVGRLEEKKGHRHLLEACRELRASGLELYCSIVGDGRERERLERLRQSLGLEDCVELLGEQPRDRIRSLLEGARVFVLPSVTAPSGRADGIPVALMEAMAMERPVVSTRISGIPELVRDGESGLLVEPGDARALARALRRLCGDPALAARLARAGRRRVCEDFDLERNVAALRRLFAESGRETATEPTSALGRALSTEGRLR